MVFSIFFKRFQKTYKQTDRRNISELAQHVTSKTVILKHSKENTIPNTSHTIGQKCCFLSAYNYPCWKYELGKAMLFLFRYFKYFKYKVFYKTVWIYNVHEQKKVGGKFVGQWRYRSTHLLNLLFFFQIKESTTYFFCLVNSNQVAFFLVPRWKHYRKSKSRILIPRNLLSFNWKGGPMIKVVIN